MMDLTAFLNNEYFLSLAFALGAFILGVIVFFVLKVIGNRLKFRNPAARAVLKTVALPLFLLIFLIGLFFASRQLTFISDYSIWGERIFFALSVLVVAYLAVRLLNALIGHWLQVKKKFEKTPKLINILVVITVYTIAALMILAYFDIEISPLLATLGLGGLAVGLALKDTLSNLFAGVHIISDKQINVDDYVKLEGTDISGHVADIGWRSTKIKTLANNLIIVPNSKLAESVITNTSRPVKEQSLVFECGVGYNSDLKKVEKVASEVAKKVLKSVKGGVKSYDPSVLFYEFGDSNIKFWVILRIKSYVDKFAVQHEFIKALKKRFDKEKIEISWPVVKVYQAKKKVD